MPATQFPAWLAGMATSAGNLADGIPWTVVKPSDQSETSSTTLANDNDLQVVSVGASSSWFFACFVSYEGGTQGSSDLKFEWAIPSGSMKAVALYPNTSGTLTIKHISASGTTAAGSNGAGTNLPLVMAGTINVGITGGAVVLQWAQNTSSLTATKVHAGSGLLMVEVS